MSPLPNAIEAKARGKEKDRLVLEFLRCEIFSSFENFMLLLKSAKSHTSRHLSRMVKKKWLEKYVVELDTGNITVWGITQLGLEEAGDAEEATMEGFVPSRISFLALNHTLMNQKVCIQLSNLGWKGWQNADRHFFKKKYNVEHRPDAIVIAPKGGIVAIETELTLKAPRRYRSIMKSHIVAKEKGYWKHIIYVVRNDESKRMLTRRFDNIEYIRFGESRYPFDKYKKMVSIFTIDEIPTLNQS
ncbi:MobC family replication-relaxation protein [Vibrio tapetis subsp. quintayensis]|uniref:MobC family replication-relaxation protein n=1 Tax=Vibrio tapetis TaxID=52443 RepID=UPI0025B3F567|nr:MobC family replication-relaxation protein [Vibrio tapetis]MDN3683215.1 MobC family replication-relaxation protein [Vibrio tapetis subsp. quintayensis]